MRSVSITLSAASKVLINTAGCVVVHATRETAGSTAVYRLWDSDSAAGALLLPVSLVANESTRDDFQPHHLPFNTGLYFELVSGTLEGSVTVMCDHRCHDALHWAYEQMVAGS